MKETEAAGRYARALFMAVAENRSVPAHAVLEELARLSRMICSDPVMKAALRNPLAGAEQKKSLVRKSLGPGPGEHSKMLFNFLDLLISKKRIDLVQLIVTKFEQALEESKGTMKAYVKSASALDESSKKQIEEKLTRLFKKKIFIETSVNPELLAGAVVRAGDAVIDNSLRSQLKNMKNLIH